MGGLTVLPVELVPGGCYLAAAAAIQGSVKLLSLSASVGEVTSVAHVDDEDLAAVVTFCAGAAERGKLEVEVRGTSPIWIAALWPVARQKLGERAP